MVAKAFLPKPDDTDLFVLHKDGDKHNNRYTNLYYGSVQDNSDDMIRHGNSTLGERNPQARLDENAVREIRKRYRKGETQKAIASCFDISFQSVSDIVNKKSWSHIV